MYGRCVTPVPAQPKTVTVCLCILLGQRHLPPAEQWRLLEASIGAYLGSNGFQGICFPCPLS